MKNYEFASICPSNRFGVNFCHGADIISKVGSAYFTYKNHVGISCI